MTETARRPRAAADLVAACLLLALPWVLYGSALGLWWTADDFRQLRYTLDHSPAEYSFDPAIWQQLPNRVLTPLLFVSYDADLALFGLSPAAFYAHQLASIGLMALALYLVLRLWLPPPSAALGGVVLLLGPVVASFPPLLMVRHYPEAMALGLLSAWTFGLAARRGRGAAAALAALSALLYLAASAAKEIAVPLPAVLALLPVATTRRRLLLLVPHAAVGASYAAYRAWMLGTPLGGYGWAVLPGQWPAVVMALPGRLAAALAGPSAWGWAALAVLLGTALVYALRSARAAALLAAGLMLAALPVLPVSLGMAPRFGAASWLVVAAAFAPAAHALARRPERRLAAALLVAAGLVTTAVAGRAAWAQDLARARRESAEDRGLLALGVGDVIRHPIAPPAALRELRIFAREVLGRPARGDWFYDDLYLCRRPLRRGAPPRIRALWTYDRDAGALIEITDRLPVLRREYCASIRRGASLEATFRPLGDRVLAWELGPYEDGRYAFVFEEGRQSFDVPRRAAFTLGTARPVRLRVRYQAPEGWVTYSPPLRVPSASGEPLEWRRGVPKSPSGGTG